jgi:hypothetical protein
MGDPFEATSGAPACQALSLAWIGETAVALVVASRQGDVHESGLFAISTTGSAAELLVDGGDALHVASELDGAVVLGQSTWSLLRAVPAAVQRVWPCLSSLPSVEKECCT